MSLTNAEQSGPGEDNTTYQDEQPSGGGNFWETATAILNAAGDITQVIDGAGNDITDQVDNAYQVGGAAQVAPAPDNSTLYWALGAVFFLILALMAFLLLKKK